MIEISEKKIIDSFAIAFVYSKPELIALLNDKGASIKKTATNQKVLDVFKGFITSDKKFAQCYVNFLFQKGYLKESDIYPVGQDQYLNVAGMTAGMIAQGVGDIWQGIGKMFERPEVNNDAMAGIFALETQKEANRGIELGESNSKYWIAGASIIGVLALMSVVIIKKIK